MQIFSNAAVKDEITSLEMKQAAIFGATAPATKPAKRKRGMSAAGRPGIAAAQKALSVLFKECFMGLFNFFFNGQTVFIRDQQRSGVKPPMDAS